MFHQLATGAMVR